MLTQVLKTLFGRDLEALKKEVASYHKEENLWVTDRGIANSAGNLCLHLVGNLNAFIGAEIGKTGYVRNRPLEFSQKDVPRSTLLEMLDDTLAVVNLSLDQLDEADLTKEYPLLVFKEKMSYGFFLVHLTTHLAYHLGQVNYHRRLIDFEEPAQPN